MTKRCKMLCSRLIVSVLLLAVAYGSPIVKKGEPIVKREVKREIPDAESQLKQLKNSGESVSVEESQSTSYTNVNGHEQTESHKENKVSANDQILAALTKDESKTKNPGKPEESDVKIIEELPQQNVHHFKNIHNGEVIEEEKRQSSSNHFTPMDLAEYIVRTGDEEGVANAIEEMLNERIISEEQAIQYLQEVKLDIQVLKNERDKIVALFKPVMKVQKKIMPDTTQVDEDDDDDMSVAEYENLVNKLKVANFMYNEYSLEDVIYHLAHIMFQQTLTQGNGAALDSIQKFSKFLAEEVRADRISQELQKKVLDILMTSLVDTVGEQRSADEMKQAEQSGQEEVTEVTPQANKS